jgi:myo-inositol 2-dehydrogenase / D-chiro-inositol 1-dehydrogenase
MGEKRVRLGVIGCGKFPIGAIFPCFHLAPMELVAVCDLDRDRAEHAARTFGPARVYTDHRAMLAAGSMDAVMIEVGPHINPTLAVDVMRAGLHVYIEKPPALTVQECRQLINVSRETNRFLAVGFMKRFGTAYRMAKGIVESREFGKLAHVSCKFTSGVYVPAWSKELTPFSFLLDHSIHHLDLIQHYAGRAEWVCAQPSSTGTERFGFAAVLRFASGATGLVEVSNCESRGVPNEYLRLTGEGHSVVVENVSHLTYHRNAPAMDRGRALDFDHDSLTWAPNMTAISPENWSLAHMGYLGEVRNFAECVLAGRAPKPDMVDGIAAVRLVYAIHDSNGKPVELSGAGE